MKNTVLSLTKANWSVLIVFSSVAVFCSQRGLGPFILPVALPALLYQVIKGLCAYRLPEQRAIRLTAIGIVITSLLVVYSIHSYRNYTSRTNSDQIAEAIEKFRLANSRYPTTLDELGIDATQALRSFKLYYTVYSGKPTLTYDATFRGGDFWLYDFSTHQWRYVSP
jgi:hypothetical protein